MKNIPQVARRAAPFLLICAFALLVVTPASAFFFGKSAPEEVSVSAFSKNVMTGNVITFSEIDFAAEPALDSIIITELPASTAGVLKFGSQDVQTGCVVAMSAISGLKFHPSSFGEISASFSFLPVSGGITGTEPVTVSLHLLTAENSAPIAKNLDLKTYKNIAVVADFSGMDPDGDTLTYQITDKPARGEVILSDDGSSTFVYKPYENKTGKDSFCYTAIDAVGNVSEPATVTVKINKANTKVTYSDMDGNASYCAAIRLAETGVFTGECLGESYFFCPERVVTRGEFVAMALTAAGVTDLSEVSMTGFSDDGNIPAWVKPYVTTALKAGVIKGVFFPDGQIAFSADTPITFAEAAVILNRAMRFSDVSTAAAYTDGDSIPTWASQAAVNLETCGVLDTDSVGALHLTKQVSRADAAELLVSALDVVEAREGSSGLMGWFK